MSFFFLQLTLIGLSAAELYFTHADEHLSLVSSSTNHDDLLYAALMVRDGQLGERTHRDKEPRKNKQVLEARMMDLRDRGIALGVF